MTLEPDLERYLETLRDDLPSDRDEARMRRRLTAAGLCVTTALVSHTAAASVTGLGKAGVFAALAARFASLPLMAQLGLVTVTTTVVATGPAIMVARYQPGQSDGRPNHMVPTKVRPSTPHRAAQSTQPTAAQLLETPTIVAVPPPAAIDDNVPRMQSPPTPRGASASELAEETRLIDAAQSAIRSGRCEEAAQLLAAHAERFPSGRLRHERERTRSKLLDARGCNAR